MKLIQAARFGHLADVQKNLARQTNQLNQADKDGFTPLARAAENGHDDVVSFLLNFHNLKPDRATKGGKTALYLASENGHSKVVALLLRHDVDVTCLCTETPVGIAAKNGHTEVVKLLLGAEGIDPNSRGQEQFTPTCHAAAAGHAGVVSYLAQHKDTDLNLAAPAGTPLILAAAAGALEAVRALLAAGVDVNASCKVSGQTAAYVAAARGHTDVLRLLAKADLAKADQQGLSPLMAACQGGFLETVEFLVDQKGVQVDHSSGAATAMTIACRAGHEAIVSVLLAAGAAAGLAPEAGYSPLQEACRRARFNIVRVLLASEDVDVNRCSRDGRSPLQEACWHRADKILRALVEERGDELEVNLVDKYGNTALHEAAARGNAKHVKTLLAHKKLKPKTVNAKKQSALWVACAACLRPENYPHVESHHATIRLLLEHPGVDVNKGDEVGRSPIWWMAEHGDLTVVDMLLGHPKVDVNKEDYSAGRSALHNACRTGHKEVVKALLKNPRVNVNLKDKSGQTPLGAACEGGTQNMLIIRIIVAHPGVDADVQDRCKRSPFWWACRSGFSGLVEYLGTVPGVDVNATDQDGKTPLMAAVAHGNRDSVHALVSNPKVDLNVTDEEGKTALEMDRSRALISHPMIQQSLNHRRGGGGQKQERVQSGRSTSSVSSRSSTGSSRPASGRRAYEPPMSIRRANFVLSRVYKTQPHPEMPPPDPTKAVYNVESSSIDPDDVRFLQNINPLAGPPAPVVARPLPSVPAARSPGTSPAKARGPPLSPERSTGSPRTVTFGPDDSATFQLPAFDAARSIASAPTTTLQSPEGSRPGTTNRPTTGDGDPPPRPYPGLMPLKGALKKPSPPRGATVPAEKRNGWAGDPPPGSRQHLREEGWDGDTRVKKSQMTKGSSGVWGYRPTRKKGGPQVTGLKNIREGNNDVEMPPVRQAGVGSRRSENLISAELNAPEHLPSLSPPDLE